MTNNSNFDTLLKSMLTKSPKASGKKAAKRPSSSEGVSASYAETQTHKDMSEDASSTPKYVSP